MLLEACLRLDKFIVDRANDVVRAWNWTTGRTRADLASSIQFSSLSLAPGIAFINQEYGWGLGATFLSGLSYLFLKDINLFQDKREKLALQRQAKDKTAEDLKDIQTVLGYGGIVLGSILYFGSTEGESSHPLSNELFGLCYIGLGCSQHIMRANYLPPGKTVLVRFKDKLVDMLRQPVQGTV
jgi:hypothetical protein